MRLRTRPATDGELRSYIDTWLAKVKLESITVMVHQIRVSGFAFPTNHSEAMNVFERLGYQLVKHHNHYGALLRTYIKER